MLELSRNDLDVGMVAADTSAMLRFYGEAVGLPAAGALKLPGRGVIHKFVAGTNLVKVFEPATSLRATTDPAVYPWQRTGLQYWSLHVVDLDPLVARLAEHGVEPIGGVIDTGIGIRYMLVNDPDGNVVEFIEGDGAAVPAPTEA
jgi:glyoxylase I family protein